ncbi:MAG: hypothetical protein ABWU16_02640 [Halothiobacillaceae bacterium]
MKPLSAMFLGAGMLVALSSHADSSQVMLGAGLGGALGALVGQQIGGGHDGAIVGGALGAGVGAAAGAALTTGGNDGRRVVVREPIGYGPHDNGLHRGHHKHKHKHHHD